MCLMHVYTFIFLLLNVKSKEGDTTILFTYVILIILVQTFPHVLENSHGVCTGSLE